MRILTVILLSFFLAIGPSGGCGNPAVHWNYYFYSIEELNEHLPKALKKNDIAIIYLDCSLSDKFELIHYDYYLGIHPKYTEMEDENGYIGQYGPVSLTTKLKYTYKDIEVLIHVSTGTDNKNIKLEDYVELGGIFPYQWQHKDSLDTYDNLIELYIVFDSESGLTNDDREIIYEEIKDDIFKCLKVVSRSDFYDDVLEN